MNKMEVLYIKREAIDEQKWDACIANSTNGIVYAYSWYLDRVCNRWDALIYDDYLYVMPIVRNRKYGLTYIYQPFFTQQLGIFGQNVGQEITNSFLLAIPDEIRLVEMRLNPANLPSLENYLIKSNKTFHLQLKRPIEVLRKNYRNNTIRNIKKASLAGLKICPIFDVGHFIDFTSKYLSEKTKKIKEHHYRRLKEIILYSVEHEFGELYGCFDAQDYLLAAAFFIQSNNKVIYLAASSSPEGIKQKAMFLLIDHFIEKNAHKDLILDFEGSNIDGIARFYEGFGAYPVNFFSVKKNELPWYARLIKK